ncbi:MAG TPA: ABC transporter ATP-binding protein [Bryobacteraceae bacterium]|nr:ABC transporter ATP-binding protein [Bryobacteraceae bacterium]
MCDPGSLISCQNLTRRYGTTNVVDSISFDLAPGSICAFLGPNGAGKSTTVKMLTGLLRPTRGRATVANLDVLEQTTELKRLVGVLPEHLGLFDHLTVEEHLHMSGAIYGLSKEETRSRADQLLRALVLEHGRNTFADHCSHGMRKKTALALALLHNPRVLFLDEPFEGIDPVTSKTIRDLLVRLSRRGVTCFFTSHILSIVQSIATHYILIREGRIVWNSPAGELPASLEAMYFELVEAPKSEDLPWLGSHRS